MSLEEGALALLCLRRSLGRAEVAAALRLPLPAGPEEEPGFLKEVGAFLLAGRISPGVQVVLGVPRQEFLFRRFETPPVKAGNLPGLVEFEIERHLPGKREEFLSGWRVDGKAAGGGNVVLLGAARRSAVDRVVGLLRRANVEPVSVQPEPLALAAACARVFPGTRPALLVHVGPGAFGVDLLLEGRVTFSRTFAIADPLWRESLAPGAAAELRQDAAGRLAALVAERLRDPLFLASVPGGTLPEIRLSGHGVNRSVLVERIQNALNVPVRVCSPWLLVRWGSPPADLAPFTAPLALALAGGAPGGLELAEERQEALHRPPRLRLTATLAILLAVVLAGHLGSYALRQQRQLARVEREIRSLKGKMAEVDVVNRRVQEARARLRYLRGSVRERPRQAEILRELTERVPADSYLSEYTFRERSVEITGFSPSASRLLPILEESPLFKGVEFSAPIVAQGGGLERFRIRMQLEQAGG